LKHEWTRIYVGRAFQPEICPEGASRRVVLNHEWTRITANSCSAAVAAGETQWVVLNHE
jgi:hypothetical protein